MTWSPSETLTLTLGRFNAPIGWELLDAPDMYQYTHAHVFNYGIAFNHTGLMLGWDPDGIFDGLFYIVNGSETYYDIDIPKTVGTRLGFSFNDATNMGLSLVYDHKNHSIADIDFTYATDTFTLGGQLNYGMEAVSNDMWFGGLLTLYWLLGDEWGMTVRGDAFRDTPTGSRVGGDPDEMYVSGTLSPSYYILPNTWLLLEYKATYRANAGQVDHIAAFESTYSF